MASASPPVSLVRFGSVRFGSVRFGLIWFGSVRFCLVRFGSCHDCPSVQSLHETSFNTGLTNYTDP